MMSSSISLYISSLRRPCRLRSSYVLRLNTLPSESSNSSSSSGRNARLSVNFFSRSFTEECDAYGQPKKGNQKTRSEKRDREREKQKE